MRLPDWIRRIWQPRRTIWPTRDGWWSLFASVGLGVAAVNTGNNLLYLLSSMLLALVVVSGILSEAVIRRLRLAPALPEELHAGEPAVLGATMRNEKRWIPSYSITLEVHEAAAGARRYIYLPRIPAGDSRLVSWSATMPRRGRHRLGGVRVTTRFPFGIFLKAGQVALREEVIVFPAVHPVSPQRLRELGGTGAAPTRRRGRGDDLHNLRDYRPGDDPRLIHWKSSAKTSALTVRELEAETPLDTRIVLFGGGASAEIEAGIAEAASLAVHLLRAGAQVE
ncbi:MAG TPA: DUF58 domain-containing protein, partial [Methylomirabilota bacterium]|nr:DUF58 domain-containing protein [Methylomirabilota bacterium]